MFKCILICFSLRLYSVVHTEQHAQSCQPLPSPVQAGDTCLWKMPGGNMSTSLDACRSLGGTMLSFDSITEAQHMLDALNVSKDTHIQIGAVRNSMNGSRYYDWLDRPGTWSVELDQLVTSFPFPDEQNATRECLSIINMALVPSDCCDLQPTTVCEKAATTDCPCQNKDTETTQKTSVARMPETMATAENYDSPVTASQTTGSLAIAEGIQNLYQNIESTTKRFDVEVQESARNISVDLNNTSAIFDHVFSHVINATDKTETAASQTDSSELLLIPKDNKTMWISFENLLEIVKTRSNESEYHNQSSIAVNQTAPEVVNTTQCNDTEANPKTNGGSPTFITGLFHRNHTIPLDINETNGVLVKEVPFLVSGFGVGSARPMPYTEHPPSFETGHVTANAPEFIKNITESLTNLKHKTDVTEQDFQTFTATFHAAIENTQMQTEAVDMKKYLFTYILMVAERLVNNLGNPSTNLDVKTDALEITTRLITSTSGNGTHVEIGNETTRTEIDLSKTIFENCSKTGVRVSTVLYKKVGALTEASHISSTVLSVSIQQITDDKPQKVAVSTTDAIIFTMETFVNEDHPLTELVLKQSTLRQTECVFFVKKRTENTRQCVFLNFTSKAWSTSGCVVRSRNSTHTTCSCNHLTSFAILVMYKEKDNISLENQQVLFTVTTVGCSLSIACLAMTLITYFYLKMYSREKIMIHANLSLALMLAQLVFVTSGGAHKNEDLCKAIAIALHFLFMASFTWMLVEGVALYLCCTRGVFNQRDMRCKYLLLGWAPPALIVIISVAAEFPDYGTGPQYSCWLSVHNGLIWAFLGPMLVIVLLNMLVMGLVVKVFLTLQTNTQKTEVARFRGSVRAMLTLLPLLGLTWITSLLVPYSVVFHYLFVIVNTVQGMCIFFFHCICNDEIRLKFREKTRRWSSSRTGSEVDVSNQQRRKTGSFDALKAKGGVGTSPSSNSGQRSAWT